MSNKQIIAGLDEKVRQVALRKARKRAQEVANERDEPVRLEFDNGSVSEMIYPEESN